MVKVDYHIDVILNVSGISTQWTYTNNTNKISMSWTTHNSNNSLLLNGDNGSNFNFTLELQNYKITNYNYDKDQSLYDKTNITLTSDGKLNFSGTLAAITRLGYNTLTVTGAEKITTTDNKPTIKHDDNQLHENQLGVDFYYPKGVTSISIPTDATTAVLRYIVFNSSEDYDLSNVYYITDVNTTPTKFDDDDTSLTTETFSDSDWKKLSQLVVTDENGTPLTELPAKQVEKTYSIVINNKADNISVTPSTIENVKPDTEQTFTIQANNGYNLNSYDFYKSNKYDFSGNSKEEIKTESNLSTTDAITITFTPTEKDLTQFEFYVDGTTEQIETPDTPDTPDTPTTYDYKVNNDNNKFSTYTKNGLIVTVTATDPYIFNSVKPYVVNYIAGDINHSYLDENSYTISSDKKTVTINYPSDYNRSDYTLVVNADYTDTTPTPETNKGTESIEIYTLTDEQLNKLSQKAIIRADGNNYTFSDFFKQLYRLPFHIPDTESTGTTNIKAGIYNLDVSARKFEKEHYILNIGNIKVTGNNNNGFDYNISSITLYLPFISERSLSIDDVLNKTINITYDVNLLDGKTSIIIKSDDTIISSGITNISTQLELFSIYNNRVVNTLNSTLANSIRQAYIKVEYNKPVDNLVSYETNEHGTIKNYTGYIQGVNMQGLGKLDQETQDNIKSILNGGIFINDTQSN